MYFRYAVLADVVIQYSSLQATLFLLDLPFFCDGCRNYAAFQPIFRLAFNIFLLFDPQHGAFPSRALASGTAVSGYTFTSGITLGVHHFAKSCTLFGKSCTLTSV
jgi:hypothetical protein